MNIKKLKRLLRINRLDLFFIVLVLVLALSLISYSDGPNFTDMVDLGLIENDDLSEASGIAMSRKNPDVLWAHNDSGDLARIFALNTKGKNLGVYTIDGIANRDWEDIAVGPGPAEGQQYIYIGEIGDNLGAYNTKYIYRIAEPTVNANQAPVDIKITAEKIAFKYPDGNRDAETLMVDPITKDIYVVSKKEANVIVYRAPYPQSTTDTMILERVATIELSAIVGGDISPSGFEILLKTYSGIYYWYRSPSKSLWEAFQNKPLIVPYSPEPQGEAVCWKSDSMGYYTLSEELLGIPAHLYYYPRLDPPPMGVKQYAILSTAWGNVKFR